MKFYIYLSVSWYFFLIGWDYSYYISTFKNWSEFGGGNLPLFQSESSSLYYEDQGKGIPILFVHPPILSSRNFLYQQKAFVPAFRVITFDIRGHGRSTRSEQAVTYDMISQDMLALLDHLEIEKAYIVGYSMGGSVVLNFLLNHPQRISGAVLMGGFSEVHSWKLRCELQMAVVMSKKTHGLLAQAVSWGNADSPEMYRILVEDAKQSNSANVRQYYQNALTFNCTNQLSQIQQPICLLYGENDREFHSYAALLKERLVNHELKMVSKAKHQLPTKWTEETNRYIEQFIKEQEAAFH